MSIPASHHSIVSLTMSQKTFLVSLVLALLVVASVITTRPVIAEETITPNFRNTPIHQLIETVSEVTGKNFIVDPRVKGDITLISGRAMEADELYETFLAVLQVHGYAAIPNGSTTKIVPEVNARQLASEQPLSFNNDEVITRVIQVNNIPAPQLVPILRPLVPQYGHLAAYPASNMLVISDRAANVQRIVGIVRRIDQSSDEEIEFLQLQNANADEVVRVLNQLTQSVQKDASQNLSLIADPRTNSILLGGDKALRLKVRAMVAHLDTPLEQSGATQVVYLRYAKASNIAPILQGYSTAEQQATTAAAGGAGAAPASSQVAVSILADEDTNSLVITAPPKTMQNIREVIKKLDIRRAQVLVEAIIAEVSTNTRQKLGVELAGRPGDAILLNNFGTIGAAVGALLSGDSTAQAGAASGILGQAGLTIGGGSTGSDGNVNFIGILNAIRNDNDSNVLSTPTLIALDNQEAEISIGSEIPFITQITQGSATVNTNPLVSVERKDVGITLRVTPHVIDDGTVQLEIFQEASSVAQEAIDQAVDVVTNKRTITTDVIADNGQIVALGGLTEQSLTDGESKVPILGDAPLIGTLFRNTESRSVERTLMVFIRPVILRDGASFTRYTQDKYNYLRELQLSTREEDDSLMAQEAHPVLPEFQSSLAMDMSLDSMRPAAPPTPLTVDPALDANTRSNNPDDTVDPTYRSGPRGWR